MKKSLESFFAPKNVAVVGVSGNPEKLGSVVLQNVLDAGFEGDVIAVNPKHGGEKLLGVSCIENVSKAGNPFDLVVIVVPANFVNSVIDDCIKNRTKNVIVISAGFAEIGNEEAEKELASKCEENGINLLGPNCLGVIFPYQKLNASFSDGFAEEGGICFVSQSGALCTAMLDWATEKSIGFSHFVSLGNKEGISEVDILEALVDDDRVEVFAFYLESLSNGREFLELIRKVSSKKPVVILEPGKSPASAAASVSHTGSLAPNAKVLEAAYRAAGAIQVFSMREMFHILEILAYSGKKNLGKNLVVLTNAGGVGVLTSDLTEENGLNLVEISEEGRRKLREVLPEEASVKNPVDIVGDAKADRYEKALEILSKEDGIDQVLVLLTPQRTTEVEKTAEVIVRFAEKCERNIVVSFVGGEKVESGFEILEKAAVPVFEFPVDALQAMGEIIDRNDNLRVDDFSKGRRVNEIDEFFESAKKQKLSSLPQNEVDKILDVYEFDRPRSQNFQVENLNLGIEFAKDIFPVVLKLSDPDALHKTEIKGVYLNVDEPDKFSAIWKELCETIKKEGLKDATIQVQEQISGGVEGFAGMNTDDNFGKVLVFGAGGIYTEVFEDVSMRVLPVYNEKCFDKMIRETHMGEILDGARGQGFAREKVLDVLRKMQRLIMDYPEISAIDVNPILVTDDRAVCADFKVIL
ncbi:MAG: acetate--CoA ligase family protein [Candidatus Peregrinibacteria bacterium]|nr:acetate--CoA ligase family protein [Candidatus Peregrinibacteria bacterium]